jgi:hypothetical protein
MGTVGWLAAAFPAACAYVWWPVIGPRVRCQWERLGYSLAAGVVLVVVEMLLVVQLFGRYTMAALLAPLAAALGLGLIVGGRRPQTSGATDETPGEAHTGWMGWLARAVIAAELGLVLLEVAANPSLSDWDAWAIWGVKAKAFFVDAGVGGYLSRADLYEFSWPARPCLSSLFQAFLYTCLGRVDEVGARLVHVALTGALLLIFHANLRRRFGSDSSLVWTAVLATVPNVTYQASAGLANLLLGSLLFAVLASREGWEEDRRSLRLVGPTVLLAGAFLARDEGLVMGALVTLCAFGLAPRGGRRDHFRQSLMAGTAVLLGAAVLYGLWYALVLPYGIWDIRSMWFEADVVSRLFRHRHEIPTIVLGVGRELSVPVEQMRFSPLEGKLGIALLWPLFALAGVVAIRRGRRDITGLRCALAAAGGLAIYALGLVLFPYQDLADVLYNWLYVLDRHALALVPLAVRAAASAFSLDPEAEGERAPAPIAVREAVSASSGPR